MNSQDRFNRTDLIIDSFAGSPAAIGAAWGHAYRHWAQALYYEGNGWHTPHPIEARLEELAARAIEKLRTSAPAYLAEIEAAAPHCRLSLEQMVTRIDGFCYTRGKMFRADDACFQVGLRSGTAGPLVGSIMDSPRMCFNWWRVAPARGYAHLSLTIPGTAGAGRGMNEAGLVVSESSTPNTGADYEPDLLLHILATRRVLEECRNVAEAISLMTSLPVSHAYIFADAQGNIAGLQTTPAGHAVYNVEPDGIVLANHVIDPALHATLIARGYDPDYRNANSERRVRTARELIAERREDPDFEFLRGILSSHAHYPDSICRDGNAATFIAMPQVAPDRLWIAERFPCRSPFRAYPVREG